MNLCKKKIAILTSIVLSLTSIPAHARSDLDNGNWFDWFFSIFEVQETNESISASGIRKPPPR